MEIQSSIYVCAVVSLQASVLSPHTLNSDSYINFSLSLIRSDEGKPSVSIMVAHKSTLEGIFRLLL